MHPAPGGLPKDYPWLLRINYTGRTGRFTPVVGIAEGLYAMRLVLSRPRKRTGIRVDNSKEQGGCGYRPLVAAKGGFHRESMS